jgi:hypothetical protein
LKALCKRLAVLSLFLFAPTFAIAEEAATPTASGAGGVGLAEREGLVFHTDGMVDFMRALDTNSDFAVRFMGQGSVNYFFTNRFGLAATVSYVTRSFKLGGLVSSADFVDFMVGVVGRRTGDMFSETSVSFYEIGPFLALPMGDFAGPLTLTFSNSSKMYYGVQMSGGTVYPITDGFAMGPAATIKLAFADAIENSNSNVWFWDVCFGIRATF